MPLFSPQIFTVQFYLALARHSKDSFWHDPAKYMAALFVLSNLTKSVKGASDANVNRPEASLSIFDTSVRPLDNPKICLIFHLLM